MDLDNILPEPFKESPDHIEYIGIPLKSMRTDAVLEAQLFIKIGPDRFVKYRDTNLDFDEDVRRRLYENRHTHLYLKTDNLESINKYIEANLKIVLSNASLQPRDKAEVLQDATSFIVREILIDPSSVEQVTQSERIVQHATDFIISNKGVLDHLMKLTSKDYQTHLHCVEVMTYAIVLGKRMGIKEGQELIDLGQSALLHDIGKAYVDPKINLKRGPLDEKEFNEMKRHPNFGYLALHSTGVPTRRVLSVVRYHHEDLVGRGYPRGISPSEIGLDCRIVTCADIFSALTKNRTYRKSYEPYPALKIMKEWSDSKIDSKVFREFVLMLGNVKY